MPAHPKKSAHDFPDSRLPRPGTELLFDVAVDNSDDGINRVQQIVWNGAAKNSGDRSIWGRARLTDN